MGSAFAIQPRPRPDQAASVESRSGQRENVSLSELVPSSYLEPLKIEEIFGRHAPLEVDLGCGDGTLIATLAARHPHRNFLGIERLAGRVRSACHKAKDPNVRIVRIDTAYAVRYLLPAGSVAVFYLRFPDPWPKRRHHRRRIVKGEFLDAIIRALAPGGLLRIATDEKDYFTQIEEAARREARFSLATDLNGELPPTTFEKRFLAAAQPIYRLDLRKTSPDR